MATQERVTGSKINRLSAGTDRITVFEKGKTMEEKEIRKLTQLAKPVSDYLKEHFNPYYRVVVDDNRIRIVSIEAQGIIQRDCIDESCQV